jgi:hypothetical protein
MMEAGSVNWNGKTFWLTLAKILWASSGVADEKVIGWILIKGDSVNIGAFMNSRWRRT